MDDEARAAQWRQDQRDRIQWERDNAIRMRGSRTARIALREAWEPVVLANAERYEHDPLPPEIHDWDRWTPA